MKKIGSLMVLGLLAVGLTLTGCGNADVDGKGAVTGKEETSPEMQAEIEKTMQNAQKQFGEQANQIPESTHEKK